MKRIIAMALAAYFATISAEAKSLLCVSQINESASPLDIQKNMISDLSKCKEDDAIYVWASTKLDAETLDSILHGTGAASFCDFRYPISISVASDIRNGVRRGYLRCSALGYQREMRK